MSRPINFETFFFGVATGIACVATIQYLVSLSSSYGQGQVHQRSRATPASSEGTCPASSAPSSSPGKASSNLLVPSLSSANLTPSVLASLEDKLVVTSSRLQKIVLHMVSEFKKGLANDNEVIKMLPSYVTKRPTGTLLAFLCDLNHLLTMGIHLQEMRLEPFWLWIWEAPTLEFAKSPWRAMERCACLMQSLQSASS